MVIKELLKKFFSTKQEIIIKFKGFGYMPVDINWEESYWGTALPHSMWEVKLDGVEVRDL